MPDIAETAMKPKMSVIDIGVWYPISSLLTAWP